ncbi:hypothetical protein [Pustulibacterium marinum]|nr:hypothetical protein [Pustulibacterium marinum]
MSHNIRYVYKNESGITFFWSEPKSYLYDKVQLIFRDIGFYLSIQEIKDFYNCIQEARSNTSTNGCSNCNGNKECRSILLQTPAKQVDLAVSFSELSGIEDLIKGTLFQIELQHYVINLSAN